MFHQVAGQLPVHKSGSADFSSDKAIPASLPLEIFVCHLGSVTMKTQRGLEDFASALHGQRPGHPPP